jgi:hypothetical protein
MIARFAEGASPLPRAFPKTGPRSVTETAAG